MLSFSYFATLKRIFAITLIILFLANLLGVYIYSALGLIKIHRDMRAALRELPDNTLQKLVLTVEDYEEMSEGDDELAFHGRMFDIARAVREGDSIAVYGLFDGAEDNLLEFVKAIDSNLAKDKKRVPSVLQTLLMFCPIHQPLYGMFDISKEEHATVYSCPLLSGQRQIQSPPPRV